MNRLDIGARLIERVEYPRVIHQPYITEYSPLYGEQVYPAGPMKLSPLKVWLWMNQSDPDAWRLRDLFDRSRQAWVTGATFALTLARCTVREVFYPKVILMCVETTPSGVMMEFQILQVPGTKDQCPKEDDVKVYDAIIVEVDEKGEVTSVVEIRDPFAAKSARAAQDIVMVDYAQENHLTGKDLTGIQVRVREFQATS